MTSALTRLDARLRRIPDPLLLAIGLAVMVAIAAFKTTLGHDIPIADFFLVPVAAVGWLAGSRVYGYLAAVCAASATVFIAVVGPASAPLGAAFAAAATRLVLYIIVLTVLEVLHRMHLQNQAEAQTDHKTGAANSRAFEQRATAEIERSRRNGTPMTVLYLDVDDFKDVNDRFGHTAGDRVLTTVSHMMRTSVRLNDIVARLGGDEFVVLMPETNRFAGGAVARRMRAELERVTTPDGAPVHYSIGLVTFDEPPSSVDEMIHEADTLMYRAKEKGKDRIEAASVAVSGAPPA
jgi:diguanylate cyclase (GGDEF)-like protein